MNIVLIGYRGSGKTTIGKKLAEKLNREFVDSDDYIEQRTQLSIREIFELCGESYFRHLESEAIKDLSASDGRVIATGGGAVLRYKNVSNLKSHGVVIFLDVAPDVAYDRITRDPASTRRRPSLTGTDMLTEIKEQIDFRKPYYLRAADHVIDANKLEPDQIVGEILKRLGPDVALPESPPPEKSESEPEPEL